MTEKWIKDTGLVLALVFLVLGYIQESKDLLVVSGIFLVAVMFASNLLLPFAFVWQKIAEILGAVIPKIFFGAVFFAIILPVGVLRRFLKGDMLFISKWRETRTVFKERNHRFMRQDMEVPY